MSEKTAEEKLQSVNNLISILLMMFIGLPFQAFVFQTGWNLFAERLTTIHLGYWQAFGLMTFITFITRSKIKHNENKDRDLFADFFVEIIASTLSLLMFYLIAYFAQ